MPGKRSYVQHALIVGVIAGALGLCGLVAATNGTTTPLQKTPVPQQDRTVQATPYATPAAAAAPGGSGYTNVDGNYVPSPSDDPAGASAQCADGTYSYSQNRRGTCSHHGGVARWL
jgi:hypothetical protein